MQPQILVSRKVQFTCDELGFLFQNLVRSVGLPLPRVLGWVDENGGYWNVENSIRLLAAPNPATAVPESLLGRIPVEEARVSVAGPCHGLVCTWPRWRLA